MTKAVFHGHDKVGADMAKQILTRMRFANDVINPVVDIIDSHMKAKDMGKTKKASSLRRFFGKKNIDMIITLVTADENGTQSELKVNEKKIVNVFKEVKERFPDMLPDPIITGEDLIRNNLKPGPAFKFALFHTHNMQLNGCEDKDKLLKAAIGFYKQFKE